MKIRIALRDRFGDLSASEMQSILKAFRMYDNVSLEEKLLAIREGYKSLAHAMADRIIDERRS